MQIFLIAVLLCILLATASAISCYSCESVYEKKCGENFDIENYFKIDCSRISPPRYLENDLAYRNATACMKRIYKEHGLPKIQRSCFFGDVNETDVGCRLDPTTLAVEISCDVCDDENYCNMASVNAPPTQNLILALISAGYASHAVFRRIMHSLKMKIN